MATPKFDYNKVLSALEGSEDDIIKASDPTLLNKKMAMIGAMELMGNVNETIKKTVISVPGKVPTNMLRLLMDSMSAYAIMMEKLMVEYDIRVSEIENPKSSLSGPLTTSSSLDPTENERLRDDLEFLENILSKLGGKGGNPGKGGSGTGNTGNGGNGGGPIN
jgi:uncharacterized membrane protein YgcG